MPPQFAEAVAERVLRVDQNISPVREAADRLSNAVERLHNAITTLEEHVVGVLGAPKVPQDEKAEPPLAGSSDLVNALGEILSGVDAAVYRILHTTNRVEL